jgi:HEAT repeat protein
MIRIRFLYILFLLITVTEQALPADAMRDVIMPLPEKDINLVLPVEQVKQSVDTFKIKNDSVAYDTLSIVDKAKTHINRIFILNGDSPWLRRINYFGRSFAFINALILTIMACICTLVILLAVILLNRARMEKEERLHQYLMEKYQSLIIDYLFGNTSPDDFRPIASDNYRRQVLIDQMIDVSENLRGEESKKLISLYKHLELDRDSIKRAYDYRWHKKIKGFRELAFMNIKDANEAMYEALNSSNEILRMEAQIALVRLSEDNPFEFLSHLTRPFSLWEQITLHELIVQHNIAVPGFKKWLESPNPSVVMFSLRMIKEFNQTDAEAGLRKVLEHPDPAVRQLAVQVAGDLNMTSTLEIMKRMYKNQDYNICLEIVRSMGKMPDLSMMGFLQMVLDKEDDVQLQIEATKAIENNGEEGVKALVKLMKSEYKNYNIIIRHVLDRRIF